MSRLEMLSVSVEDFVVKTKQFKSVEWTTLPPEEALQMLCNEVKQVKELLRKCLGHVENTAHQDPNLERMVKASLRIKVFSG